MALHRKNEVADFSTTITNSPGTGGLTITLASTTNLSAGMLAGTTDWYATCVKASVYQTTAEAREIVLVTAMSGSDATVTRAQFGTTALDLAAGDYIEIRPIPYHTNEWQDIIIDGDVDVNFAGITGTSLTTTGGGSLTGTWTSLGTVTTMDLNGGTIDGVTIGGSSAGAGTFSSLTATTADINGGTLDGATIGGSTAGAGTFTSLNASGGGALTGTWSDLGSVTTIDINGGTIDNTAIGGATPAAGAFTTLSTSGAYTANGTVNIANGGTATSTSDVNADDLVVGATSGNRGITIAAPAGVASLNFENDNGSYIRYDQATNNNMTFRVNNATALTIDSSQQSTFAKGVTLTTGNLTLTAGDLTLTAGNATIAGNTKINGKVSLTTGAYTTLGITSGLTTPTSSYHPINTESNAATDDLTDIAIGTPGQILILTPFNGGRDVTLKHDSATSTGRSILLNGGADRAFDTRNDTIMLVYNDIADTAFGPATGGWCEVAFSNNGV